ERRKEIASHSEDGHGARLYAAADTQVCVSAIPGEHAGKRPLVFANLLEQRVAEIVRILHDTEVVVRNLDQGQPVRFSYGETAKPDGIQQLKYGRIGADTKRQRSDGGQTEDR